MTLSRRHFIAAAAAAIPCAARAANGAFAAEGGEIAVRPVAHASFVMETPAGVFHVDPVGEPGAYAAFPAPDFILVTHEHGDHFNPDTLTALLGEKTRLITNPAVHGMLPAPLQARAAAMANGETAEHDGFRIGAVPAYNTTPERMKFHPQGRDNGYVLDLAGRRVYISGDTEDIPEMRALERIDIAFVCMNLPFTMDAAAAASAVTAFAPRHVYPYHYRGRDGGTQDPAAFARLVGPGIEVEMGGWYD
ncbi:MBL fold metallo-hydrolase [Pikeienuella sp. HZG-20]|uniref:MBL fold metallo-hydrolase n=1 Tax=Paludibacillus litoralis TaxID=3133267 RepID=UPI0030EE7D6F